VTIAVPVDLADAALTAEMAEDLAVVEAALRDTSFGGDEMFAEYYHPVTGAPLGSLNQSWTAAVALGEHGLRLAVEPRHETWWTDEIRQILAAHNATLCWADRRGRPITPLWCTATWGYLRFHEGTAQPWPSYGPQALRSWVARLTETWPDEADVYVYFNNDPGGAAVINSAQFADLARQAGRSTTRTPDVGQVAATAAIPTW